MRYSTISLAIVAISSLLASASTTWKQVRVGGGQGFVPGIVFCPKTKGIAYARTDIGGLYKLNSDDSWTPLTDWVGTNNWHDWGVDALAVDPTDCNKVYIAVGMYTISWDPNPGSILASKDGGATWSESKLTFKVGGNMPGRGIGERLAVDPNSPNILYFGARSGNGLWKSTNSGVSWTKVSNFPSTGTYVQDASNEYTADPVGLAFITFDASSSSSGQATKRIFVGVANVGTASIYVSNDAGATWSAVSGQPLTNNLPHKGVISPSQGLLYVTFNNNAGPYDGTLGTVQKYNIATGVWTDITPKPSDYNGSDQYYGWGGFAVDSQKPGTIMVANLNSWWPDGNIFRSTDSGATWSPLWAWGAYPNTNRYYKYDVSLAPWIGVVQSGDTKQIGQMIEALVIDPFDSNHWLYGTGLTIYGGRDLTNWDTVHNVTLKVLADGIEESAVQALISPPTGPRLISGMYDVEGFVHNSLDAVPTTKFTGPLWGGVTSLDWAGQVPATILRIGNDGGNTNGKQVAISTNSGSSWAIDNGGKHV
ncbi:glycoside hydrolase family 74 protein [Tulasnella calospora MUT 4182]|uniref:Glycoside hydrolase family 74 protein n=1 Tax=Tulasnella calospora MUT 4182 TaxID=1051891 RepID=A0A0C3QMX6_9AGAM|nr:glycoside hydrolase family 74 protein [Tulasnella calospora MUT 4182]